MSFNPIKQIKQHIKELFLTNIRGDERRNDEELECIQFGICTLQVKSPRSEELFFR